MIPRLALRGVEHRYPTSGFRLTAEDFAIGAGEVAVLTGPSGSGKSTLLSLAAGVLAPLRGEVALDGESTGGQSDRVRRDRRLHRIGQVLQELALIDYLDAVENVVLPVRLARGALGPARDQARDLLTDLGLGDKLRRRPPRLSGGECQRVALARGLIGKPALVLADEPTGSLDPRHARRAAELLVERSRGAGAALLFSTHDPSLVELADVHYELLADGEGPSRVERRGP